MFPRNFNSYRSDHFGSDVCFSLGLSLEPQPQDDAHNHDYNSRTVRPVQTPDKTFHIIFSVGS